MSTLGPVAILALTGLALSVTTASEPLAQPTTQPEAPLSDDPQESELESRLRLDIAPLLSEYCFRCHGEWEAHADVRLDTLTNIRSILDQIHTVKLAREMVSTGIMPPADEARQPSEHERLLITQWLDAALAYTPPDGAIDPGWITIHRLNRDEYRNTLRDLLGIDPAKHDLARELPPDDVGYGYDNIADVLTTSPTHLSAYLDAAERAVEIALGPEVVVGQEPRLLAHLQREGQGQPLRQGGQYFATNGALIAHGTIPLTGEYEISALSWGTRGGDQLPHLEFRVDGKAVFATSVSAENEAEAQRVSVRLRLPAGPAVISAHFTNDYWVPDVADRNLAIDGFSIAGPLSEESIERPELYRELIADREPERAHAEEITDWLLPRVYRRPPSDDEREALLGLYDLSVAEGGTHEYAVRQMLTGALVSPGFLYRSIAHPAPDDPDAVYELSAHELASRLSYFLWSSMPDDELRALADEGSLTDDVVLSGQVARMLADPKAEAMVRNFAGQWLLLRNLPLVDIDRGRYPDFSEGLRSDMETEARLFFGDVLRSGRPLADLIDADDVFVNERLAKLYGIAGVEGDSFRQVVLAPDSVRGGVLTLGATLLVTSNPTRTSPVKRGLYVLEHILGTPPPPPPPDIPRLEQAARDLGEGATLRQQLEAHLTDSSCVTCHQRMDPIGLAMENFDAIGAWREAYPDAPIDAFGVLPGGVAFRGPEELKGILLSRLDAFREHLASEVLTYAIGRGVEPFDRPAIRRICEETRDGGDSLGVMIESVVLSETFRTCRGRQPR